MCSRIECPTCHRPTFSGCGRHVEQVLGDVPAADRCPGHAAAPREPGTSFFSRLRR